MVPIAGHWEAPESGRQAVLVFTEGQRSMGLMVDEILDVVEEPLVIQPGSDRLGYLGSAVISERVTDVIDTVYWLCHAGGDWFRGDRRASSSEQKPRLLLIDEPLSALDPTRSRQAVATLLTGARERGVTLVATLHQVDRALSHFNRIVGLRDGRLVLVVPGQPPAGGQCAG